MFDVDYATESDLVFWGQVDPDITESELLFTMARKRCYILKVGPIPVGVMRYSLFWDSIPFLNLIYIEESAHGRGYGSQAMEHWESEMCIAGFPCVMTSARVDEEAQFFYRGLGYRDTGCLILDIPRLTQPAEIFFVKQL